MGLLPAVVRRRGMSRPEKTKWRRPATVAFCSGDYPDRDTTNVACRERVSADVGGRERCVVDRVVGSLVSVTPDRAATVVDADEDRSASGVAERD